MRSQKVRLICVSGLFCAIVFLFTTVVKIPSHTGYTHVGDGFIYLAACILPLPYAAAAGAGGALLADCLTGYAIWAPGTLIIKSLTVFLFSRKAEKIICKRNIFALIPAALLCSLGYYLYESLMTLNFISPLAGIPGYIIQSSMSSILFIFAGAAVDKLNIKHAIKGEKEL